MSDFLLIDTTHPQAPILSELCGFGSGIWEGIALGCMSECPYPGSSSSFDSACKAIALTREISAEFKDDVNTAVRIAQL